jgi:hypothetical protein
VRIVRALIPGLTLMAGVGIGSAVSRSGELSSVRAELERVESRCEEGVPELGPAFFYQRSDSPARQRITFHRRGDQATLVVVGDGQMDDSVAATRSAYALSWSAERAQWELAGCAHRVLECQRGWRTGGKCP